MYGPVPGGTLLPVTLSEVLPGTANANGSASLSRNSGSGLVRWMVSVFALSSATTPWERSHVLAFLRHASAPTMPA